MTGRYGIDTSVLVGLITRLPEDMFRRCQGELTMAALPGVRRL